MTLNIPRTFDVALNLIVASLAPAFRERDRLRLNKSEGVNHAIKQRVRP